MIAIVNSQCEYWKREFGADITIKDSFFQTKVLEIIRRGIKPVVQIDNDLDELQFLSKLPKKSIIAWLHSDEALNTSFNKKIIRLDSVSLILRPYHLNNPEIKNLKLSALYFLKNIKHLKSIAEYIKMFFWLWRGFGMYSREKKIIKMLMKKQKPFHNFPLGYTDVFCKSFLKISEFEPLISNQSLLSDQFTPKVFPINSLSFVGQVGQIVRTVAIRSAEKAPGSNVIKRTEYGAGNYDDKIVQTNGLEYVRMVLSSKFILCPPGNISGNSFRIHETVVSKRVPIVVSNPLSDPNFVSPFNDLFKGNDFQSWDQVIDSLPIISESRYGSLVESNFKILQNQIFIAKAMIEKVLSQIV
jgi:hypothetical protein